MKRNVLLLLIIVMAFSVTACGAPAEEELLSAPYAEMLKSGDYQYTYALTYENKPYTATIATYNDMICKKVVADDGSYNARVVSIDGNAWEVDELTGAVTDGGTEKAETLPDYDASLVFVEQSTLEDGTISEVYDFEYEGQKCTMEFIFGSDNRLKKIMMTTGENTAETEIENLSTVGNDKTLFDAPQ